MNMQTRDRCTLVALMLLVCVAARAATPPAFPGAEGFGAQTTGGRGGAVYYVTTLDPDPAGVIPGSLNHALAQAGPRYVLFKVSGVIHGIGNLVHGDVTIAGQTSPGGVIVRGLICDGHYERNDCDNVIARHLRLRPAWTLPLPAGGERLDDGLRLDGISGFIFDHLSIAHAVDEAAQLSWAAQGTIQRSVFAETVGDHADRGGMLLNYSHPEHPQDQLSILKNLWYRIGGRVPEITCEASAYEGDPGSAADCQTRTLDLEVSNNFYFDPGFLLWYNRDVDQNNALGPYRQHLNLVNNEMQVRASFPYGMALHDLLDVADNQLFVSGNRLSRYPAYVDYQLFYCCNDFAGNAPNTDPGSAQQLPTRHPHGNVSYIAGAALRNDLLGNVGAYPLDPMDRRIRANVASGVIDPVSYELPLANDPFDLDFPAASPPAPPVDSDSDGMPDAFEIQHAALGLNPGVADHNGATLSVPLTGIPGYTNLEVYLNLLADGLVSEGASLMFRNGFEQ
jgi:pectate lyase